MLVLASQTGSKCFLEYKQWEPADKGYKITVKM